MVKPDHILRSSTGMYHMGRGNASTCNGRSGKFVKATNDQVHNANESSFCKKCFWEGKKTAEIIINDE